MALASGDTVIPAGSFNGSSQAANLSVGTLCPDGLLLGTYTGDADEFVIWNNGNVSQETFSTINLRKCETYTGTDFLGKTVQLTDFSADFRGTVILQLNTELDDTNGDGTQVPVIVVKTPQFTYVAEASSVTEV